MTLTRFCRLWRKYRPLPRLYEPETLRIPPEDQFMRELMVSLGSWNNTELDHFIRTFKVTPVQGSARKTEQARNLVLELFDAFHDGIGYQVNISNLREIIR